MMKDNSKRPASRQVQRLIPLLVLLVLSLLASSAFAQDRTGDGDNPFEQDKHFSPTENLTAPAEEVWIPTTRDAFISSNNRDRNYGFDSLINFGFQPSGLGATRPLFFFDVRSFIPSGANISRAELHVYLTSNNDPSNTRGYAAHALHSSWDEGFVTWNNTPGFGGELGRGTLGNSPGWQVTEVTTLVRNWQSRPNDNHGIILIGDERPDQNFQRGYFSRQSSSGLGPRLRVIFDRASVDDRAPIANVVQPSAGAWSPANFVARWEGSDPNNSNGSAGSGIRWFDVFYTTDNGTTWRVGRAQVTSTETNVSGVGHLTRMGFYARARDNAGNQGPDPSGSGSVQTWTRIDAQAPQATMNPLPETTQVTSFEVSWREDKESQESGIRGYDVQFREAGGTWTQLVYGTTSTTAVFSGGRNGVTYEFRARGTDNVGNVQEWGDAQASTTVYSEPLAEIVPFVPFVYQKLDGPAAGDSFTVAWRALTQPGVTITSFDVRYRAPGSSSWTNWLTGTTLSSSPFNLSPSDPDGVYTFQARATNSQGVTGPFEDQLSEQIIVDRNSPFISAQSAMPIVFSRIPDAGFTSGQQIQNTGSGAATGIMTAFNLAGQSYNCGVKNIAPGASQTFLTDVDCPVDPTFFGSAVASADRPIVSIVNVNNRGTGAAAGQYQGTNIGTAGSPLYFPLVKNDHSGRTTIFFVQNVGSGPANITAVFSVNGINHSWNRNNVPASTTVVIDPSDASPPVPAGQGNVGSLIVNGTQPLAGSSLEAQTDVAIEENLQASRAFTDADGAETVYCPLYRNAHTAKGQTTGAQVQNIGSSAVNVQFTVNAGGQAFGPYTANIAAGSSHTFYAPSLAPAIPAGTVGSATITADGPVVAVVNDRGTQDGFDLLTTYACFGEGSTTVNVPLAKEFSGGNTTGVQVQNAGDAPAKVTLAYRATDGRTLTIETRNPVQPGQSVTAWGISNLPDSTWLVTSGIAANMANSVNGVVASSDQPLTVIANESSSAPNPSGQDTKNYEGFGQ